MDGQAKTSRIWTGRNLFQAQLMEELLRERQIEYFRSEDTGLFLAGGPLEISFWVQEEDAGKARLLLEEKEEEMSTLLDGADEPEELED